MTSMLAASWNCQAGHKFCIQRSEQVGGGDKGGGGG